MAAVAVANGGKVTEKKGPVIPRILYHRTKNITETYETLTFLGKGGFATCFQISNTRTGTNNACKIVSKSQLTKPHQRDKMAQEIAIHRDLKHRFIVDFVTNFEDDVNVYIVLELCSNKSLMELQKRRKCITEPEMRYFLKQIALAVDYLHSRKIIHRDLKLGNIFINDQMNLKIGDFGLATVVEYSGERKKTLCGTPNYIAPEVLGKKGHSYEVDIWSIGCIVYTLMVGTPPFETQSLKETYAKITRGEYVTPSNKISSEAKGLVQKLLQVDPALRPSAQTILTSSFILKGYIPTSLPASVLTMAPRFETRQSYVPDPAGQALNRRPLWDHNSNSAVPFHVFLTPEPVEKESCPTYMKTLFRQMNPLLGTIRSKRTLIDDESENPNCAPIVWVTKWVDYSDKYGFGYQLSDDSIGVSFNDQSRIILLPDGLNMIYIDKNGVEYHHTRDMYPVKELEKKVKLLNYFQQYMSENLVRAGGIIPSTETANMTRLPSIWTWFRTSRAVVMVLTNGSLQINNFQDHSKMILCPLMGAITTLEPDRPVRTFKFSSIEKYGCTSHLYHKLEYGFKKLEVVIGTKCSDKISMKQQSANYVYKK